MAKIWKQSKCPSTEEWIRTLCPGSPAYQPTVHEKYFLKIPESSKKQNLNLPHSSNYLDNIYIVFTSM